MNEIWGLSHFKPFLLWGMGGPIKLFACDCYFFFQYLTYITWLSKKFEQQRHTQCRMTVISKWPLPTFPLYYKLIFDIYSHLFKIPISSSFLKTSIYFVVQLWYALLHIGKKHRIFSFHALNNDQNFRVFEEEKKSRKFKHFFYSMFLVFGIIWQWILNTISPTHTGMHQRSMED